MTEMPAHVLLDKFFAVISEEARRNPSFARRLVAALPQNTVVRIEAARKSPARTFDAKEYHAVNVLEAHGEPMLRGRLSSLRAKAELREVARASGLMLTGKGRRKNASREEIIEDIVIAAKQYLKGRSS